MQHATFARRNWFLSATSARILSLAVVLAGFWQIVVPFLLNFADEQIAMRNAVGSGIALVLFAGLGAFGLGRWSRSIVSACSWLACLTGLWLLISPWLLRYQEVAPAFWSAILVGVLSFIIAAIVASQRHGSDVPVTS